MEPAQIVMLNRASPENAFLVDENYEEFSTFSVNDADLRNRRRRSGPWDRSTHVETSIRHSIEACRIGRRVRSMTTQFIAIEPDL